MPTPAPGFRDLFERLIEAPADRRPAMLDSLCAGDDGLRRELESMLHADASNHGFLDVCEEPEDTRDPLIGETLGGYRLNRRLGAGGMGIVFEARQDSPRRDVALKLLRGGFATGAQRARFEREAEVLAQLEHSAIARIYEAGRFAIAGQEVPFISMELVRDARDVCTYAEQERLDLRHRLMLFQRVCEAVGMAHEHGIVHRDLKPANILVGRDGQPRVIDFGVSRAVEPDAYESGEQTATGQLIGTPRYMSPEQMRGNGADVGPRTDVWCLGVLLHELLTGALPFPVASLPFAALVQVVLEREPSRLSKTDPALRGDLDIIAARCLNKDPEQRYASASALGDEIGRHLAGEPIEARRDHAIYVLSRRLRRHRAFLIATCVVLLIAVGSGIGFAVLWRDATQAQLQSQRRLYEIQLDAAANAFATFRTAELKQNLRECAERFRGWEWDHLSARADDALWSARPWDAEINGLAFVRSGATVAVALRDGRIGLLDPASGAETGVLEGHTLGVSAIAEIPGPRPMMASTSWDRTAKVWNLDTGESVLTLPHADEVWRLAVRPDGEVLYTGDRGGTLRAWRCDTGELLWSERRHGGRITSLAVDPTGATLASGADDWAVCLTHAATGELSRQLGDGGRGVEGVREAMPRHQGPVFGLAFAEDGRRVLSASEDGILKAWNAATGDVVWFEATGHQLAQLVVSPDGRVLALAARNCVRLRDQQTGRTLEPLRGLDGHVAVVEFSADSQQLLATDEAVVRSFDVELRGGGRAHGRVDAEGYTLGVSGHGGVVASGDEAGVVQVFAGDPLRPASPFRAHEARIRRICLDAEGRRMWTAADDRRLRVWRIASGEMEAEVEAPAYPNIGWSPRHIAMAGAEPVLSLHALDDLREIARVTTPDPVHTALAVSSDGRRIYTAGKAGWVRVWDGDSLRLLDEWRIHEGAVLDMKLCDQERRLLSCGEDGRVAFWVVDSHVLEAESSGIPGPMCVAASADLRRILVCSARGSPRVLAADTGRTLLLLDGHDPNTLWRGLASLPGGRFVSVDSRGGLREWSGRNALGQ